MLVRPYLAALALFATPLAAAPSSGLLGQLRELQAQDAMLQTIGFRLAIANAPMCADVAPSIGLLLADMRNYSQPDPVRRALKLKGDFAVEALASNSPAAKSALAVGTEVVSLEGEGLASIPAARANDSERLTLVEDRIDAALATRGKVTLGLATGSAVELAGVPACRSRFELVTQGDLTGANGKLVLVSWSKLRKAVDDDERAFIVAHELAHNVLRHRAKLKAEGGSIGTVRETEREADRLALWLMANAGFDPAGVAAFERRRGAKGLADLLSDGTHDRTEDRARLIEAELGSLNYSPVDARGLHDWRNRFTPFAQSQAPAKALP